MKKLISLLAVCGLCAVMLSACGGSGSSSAAASEPSSTATSEATSEAASQGGETAFDASVLDAAVAAIEEVNPVSNPRVIDDFSLEHEMGLTPANIVAFKGDVTNDQADCSLVFVAYVQDGTADAVVAELEAYRQSMTGNLYAEFADKVAKAEDARIVSKGNYVAMVISGITGPDYTAIDAAIDAALPA